MGRAAALPHQRARRTPVVNGAGALLFPAGRGRVGKHPDALDNHGVQMRHWQPAQVLPLEAKVWPGILRHHFMGDDLSGRFLARWHALAAKLGLDESQAKLAGNYLLAQYSGSDRHYHDVRHIVSMLDGFESLRTKFETPIAAELAIFFHDVIYDASRGDNEAQSAGKMKDILSGRLDLNILEAAAFSIGATSKHTATASRDTNLILDLDMAILGRPWADYERYALGVMREYLPVYGEEAYRKGRPKLFLEPTIAQGNVYLTDEFRHLNDPALRNMRRESEILSSGKPLPGMATD